MSDYRKVVDPSTLDTLMFLRSYSDLWMRAAEIWIDNTMKEAAGADSAQRLQHKKAAANTPATPNSCRQVTISVIMTHTKIAILDIAF